MGRPAPPPRALPATLSVQAEVVGSGLFDGPFYAMLYQDLGPLEDRPLEHFLTIGLEQGRRPSPGFDPFEYAAANPDVGGAGKALLHYIRCGAAEGRDPCAALYDHAGIQRAVAAITASGMFDAAYYRATNPVVSAESLDPLLHYLLWGAAGQCDVAPERPMHAYLGAYPDLRESEINPLLHWLDHGKAENRQSPTSIVSGTWHKPGFSAPLPDDAVGVEILRGKAYFTAHRFGDGTVDGHTREAIAGLAARRPLLRIEHQTPDVSVIIAVCGHLPFVLGCLDSLAEQRSRFSVEVILADGCSAAAIGVDALAAIPWIRLDRMPQPGGFGDCCNFAAARARGATLVLLNSNVRVAEDWLDELAGSFELFPKAGLAGSKLFNSDGTLQEAGGLFRRDGSAESYGRGQDSNRPEYCYARRVDYVSGISVALPAAVWRQMGGFDVTLQAAYCEDVDLAFRVRRAGYETWFQPLSRVLLHGESSSPDLAESKAFRAASRYASEVSAFALSGGQAREADRLAGSAMLVLDAETHTPDRDAGSEVASRLMTAFRQLGFSQAFLAQDSRWKPVYSAAMQRIGVECYYAPYTGTVGQLLSLRADFELVLAFRFFVAGDAYALLRQHLPAARILFSNVDLHFMREEREAAITGNKAVLFQSVLTKARELELFTKVDCSLVHTPEEHRRILAELPAKLSNIVELPWITEVERSEVPFHDRYDIMFLGGFRHTPNGDAVKFFLDEVWPELSARLPENARFLIVGASPPDDILALAGARVVVTGYVPDLRVYLDQARVFVAPLRYGAGIKGKVITALSHGLPCVASPIALEGMDLAPDQDVIVAADARAVIDGVLRVYSDPALWDRLQIAGYKFIADRMSPERAVEICRHALDVADETWMRRAQGPSPSQPGSRDEGDG